MVAVPIAERAVWVRPWLHVLQCPTGGAVLILLLDTDVSENDPDDRGITSRLYGGDATLRLNKPRLYQTPDLMVGALAETGEYLHLSCEQALFVRR